MRFIREAVECPGKGDGSGELADALNELERESAPQAILTRLFVMEISADAGSFLRLRSGLFDPGFSRTTDSDVLDGERPADECGG